MAGTTMGSASPAPDDSSAGLWGPDRGPDQLEAGKQVITVTNAPAGSRVAATNTSSKGLTWSSRWEKWDGLHFELRRQTLLSHYVVGLSNVHTVHLEESRMAGKLGAKVAVDAAAFLTEQSLGDFDNGVELRRLRVYAKGDCLIVLPVAYEIELGYVPGSFYIENSYLMFHNLGFLGDLQAGQFQVPMTLVNYGSSRDMMFMESATPLQALAPGVNAGFQVGRPVLDERMTWALGWFTDSVGNDFGDATKGFGRMVGRITGLPIDVHEATAPEKQRLLHLGISGSLLYTGDNTVRYQSRPESHLAPFVVDTGDVPADSAYVGGLEAAWVHGPLCVQAEYLHTWVEGRGSSDTQFGGGYVSASWLLTGESRPYDPTTGTFGRLIPRKNFNPREGDWGAWEVAARCSHLDLNSQEVSGGRITMFMFGLNWYLHSHVKWRFNHGFGNVSGRTPNGDLTLFQTRLEVDF